ncbi:hypothetical protein FQN60_009175 [Etheostoma spectabile]|uniref:Uncharacterized protein n=1 Tax=Etheostoma spectabile TaxID=54343 RepID=A0A5J5CBZ1_9PERO|nr:hypothetical protein FQN60_009175 [Etheostoma spectabile]
MDQFLSALRERGVPEENLARMAEDKVKDLWNQLQDPNFVPQIPRERVDCCCSHLGLWMAEISVISSPTCPTVPYSGAISLLLRQSTGGFLQLYQRN